MNENENRILSFLQQAQRIRLGFKLPDDCPCCQQHFNWGWLDEDLATPSGERVLTGIRMRIPRPDQTVFCPDCENRILN